MPKNIEDWQLDAVEGMSSREAAAYLGVGKSTINDARKRRANAAHKPQEPAERAGVVSEYNVPEAKILRRKVSKRDAETGSWDSVEWAPNDGVGVIEIARAVTPKVVVPEYSFAPVVGSWKTAIVYADEQIGFRGDDAFHDDAAINVAHAIVEIERPDQVIHAGDYMDLATLSRFEQEDAFRGSMQRAFDRGNEILAIERELVGDGEVVVVEGNHDRRMQRFANENAQDVMHLRKANSDEEYPALSVPGILRCQELGVKYMDAYPASTWWINDNLRVIHGTKVNSNGSTAARYATETPHISVIFGHTHRREILNRTTFDRHGKIESSYINPGCLCKVDGSVPSVKGSTGINGQSATVWEDWQQGLVVIRYKDTGEFRAELVEIKDGMAIYSGQELYG